MPRFVLLLLLTIVRRRSTLLGRLDNRVQVVNPDAVCTRLDDLLALRRSVSVVSSGSLVDVGSINRCVRATVDRSIIIMKVSFGRSIDRSVLFE